MLEASDGVDAGLAKRAVDDSKFHGMTTKLSDDGGTGMEVEQKFDMRKRDPYDAYISLSQSLPPLFEEYKFVSSHPQWSPPSIMCCVGLPSGATSVTQMMGYHSLAARYPFCFQEEFAISNPESCEVFHFVNDQIFEFFCVAPVLCIVSCCTRILYFQWKT